MDKIDELNKCSGHDGIDCVYQHRCPSTGVEYIPAIPSYVCVRHTLVSLPHPTLSPPSTATRRYNHKCDGFIFVHNDRYIFNTDTYMMKWKPGASLCTPLCCCLCVHLLTIFRLPAAEDLSIDFLVVFELATKPKFYYIDEGQQLVDVTLLLRFDRGSQLSDHDVARLLAGAAALVCFDRLKL